MKIETNKKIVYFIDDYYDKTTNEVPREEWEKYDSGDISIRYLKSKDIVMCAKSINYKTRVFKNGKTKHVINYIKKLPKNILNELEENCTTPYHVYERIIKYYPGGANALKNVDWYSIYIYLKKITLEIVKKALYEAADSAEHWKKKAESLCSCNYECPITGYQ